MRRFFFIFTAWGLLLTFSVNSVLASNLPSLPAPGKARAAVSIPSDLGKVLSQSPGTAGKPAIYLIQDAHSILGAQRSIQRILDLLTLQDQVSLVALEGATGPLATDLLRAYPDPVRLRDVLWQEAEEGTLSGGEIESILGPGTAEFQGIEKRDVYEKNFEAFRKAHQAFESSKPSFDECAARLKELIDKQFSADLKKSWVLRESFSAGSISLLAYLEGVIALAGAPPASFPALHKMAGLISEEKKAEGGQEIARWIRSAFDRLEKGDRTTFSLLKQKSDTSQISKADLVRELRARLETKGDLEERERATLSFIATQEDIDRISGTGFMDELTAWTNSLEDKWTGGDPALRETLVREKKFRIVKHYLALELTREEWLEIEKDPRSFSSESFENFFRDGSGSQNRPSFDWDLKPAEEFYRLVTARDRIFSKTLQSLIREKRPTAVAVVTGGFHTDPLASELKSKGFPVTVIQPRFEVTGESPYLKVMMGTPSVILSGSEGSRDSSAQRSSPLGSPQNDKSYRGGKSEEPPLKIRGGRGSYEDSNLSPEITTDRNNPQYAQKMRERVDRLLPSADSPDRPRTVMKWFNNALGQWSRGESREPIEQIVAPLEDLRDRVAAPFKAAKQSFRMRDDRRLKPTATIQETRAASLGKKDFEIFYRIAFGSERSRADSNAFFVFKGGNLPGAAEYQKEVLQYLESLGYEVHPGTNIPDFGYDKQFVYWPEAYSLQLIQGPGREQFVGEPGYKEFMEDMKLGYSYVTNKEYEKFQEWFREALKKPGIYQKDIGLRRQELMTEVFNAGGASVWVRRKVSRRDVLEKLGLLDKWAVIQKPDGTYFYLEDEVLKTVFGEQDPRKILELAKKEKLAPGWVFQAPEQTFFKYVVGGSADSGRKAHAGSIRNRFWREVERGRFDTYLNSIIEREKASGITLWEGDTKRSFALFWNMVHLPYADEFKDHMALAPRKDIQAWLSIARSTAGRTFPDFEAWWVKVQAEYQIKDEDKKNIRRWFETWWAEAIRMGVPEDSWIPAIETYFRLTQPWLLEPPGRVITYDDRNWMRNYFSDLYGGIHIGAKRKPGTYEIRDLLEKSSEPQVLLERLGRWITAGTEKLALLPLGSKHPNWVVLGFLYNHQEAFRRLLAQVRTGTGDPNEFWDWVNRSMRIAVERTRAAIDRNEIPADQFIKSYLKTLDSVLAQGATAGKSLGEIPADDLTRIINAYQGPGDIYQWSEQQFDEAIQIIERTLYQALMNNRWEYRELILGLEKTDLMPSDDDVKRVFSEGLHIYQDRKMIGIFLPSDIRELVAMFRALKIPKGTSYLSLGSGLGSDAIVAALFGLDVTMAEIDPRLLELSRKVIRDLSDGEDPLLKTAVIQGDGPVDYLSDNFKTTPFKAIYYFDRGLVGAYNWKRLEAKLKAEMSPDAALLVYQENVWNANAKTFSQLKRVGGLDQIGRSKGWSSSHNFLSIYQRSDGQTPEYIRAFQEKYKGASLGAKESIPMDEARRIRLSEKIQKDNEQLEELGFGQRSGRISSSLESYRFWFILELSNELKQQLSEMREAPSLLKEESLTGTLEIYVNSLIRMKEGTLRRLERDGFLPNINTFDALRLQKEDISIPLLDQSLIALLQRYDERRIPPKTQKRLLSGLIPYEYVEDLMVKYDIERFLAQHATLHNPANPDGFLQTALTNTQRLMEKYGTERGLAQHAAIYYATNPDAFIDKVLTNISRLMKKYDIERGLAQHAAVNNPKDPDSFLDKALADVGRLMGKYDIKRGLAQHAAINHADPDAFLDQVMTDVPRLMEEYDIERGLAQHAAVAYANPNTFLEKVLTEVPTLMKKYDIERGLAQHAAVNNPKDPDSFLDKALADVGRLMGKYDIKRGLAQHAAINHADPDAFLDQVMTDVPRLMEEYDIERGLAQHAAVSYSSNPDGFIDQVLVNTERLIEKYGIERGLAQRAAVHNPNDPDSFLDNALTNIDLLMEKYEIERSLAQHAAIHHPSNPDVFLEEVLAEVPRLMKKYQIEKSLAQRAAVNNSKDPDSFLDKVLADVGRLMEKYEIGHDLAQHTAISNPRDPDGFLDKVFANVPRLIKNYKVSSYRAQFSAIYYPSDPDSYLKSFTGKSLGQTASQDLAKRMLQTIVLGLSAFGAQLSLPAAEKLMPVLAARPRAVSPQVMITLPDGQAVTVDTSQDRGDDYYFSDIKLATGENRVLLSIEHGGKFYNYFSNGERTKFTYFATVNRDFMWTIEHSPSERAVLAAFYDDPHAVSLFQYVSIMTFFNESRGQQSEDFAFNYFNRVLEAVSAEPQRGIPPGSIGMTGLSYADFLSSGQKEVISQKFEALWDLLPPDSKFMILSVFDAGGNATVDRIANFWIRYLKEDVPQMHPDVSTQAQWISARLTPLQDLLRHLDLDPALRSQILNQIFDKLNALPEALPHYNVEQYLLFMYEVLVKGDGIFLNASDHRPGIQSFIKLSLLSPGEKNFLTLSLIYNYLPDFTDSEDDQALQTAIHQSVVTLSSQEPTASDLHLLAALHWPILPEDKLAIEAYFQRADLSALLTSPSELNELLAAYGNAPYLLGRPYTAKPLGLSEAGQDKLFKEMAQFFLDRFDEAELKAKWVTPYRLAFLKLTHILKQSPSFLRQSEHFLPLLEKFNPQQPEESDDLYQGRLAFIRRLWTEDRIFFDDLGGYIFKTSDRSGVVLDSAKNFPGWTDLITLNASADLISRAIAGGVSLATDPKAKPMRDPMSFAGTLAHEAGHSRHNRGDHPFREVDIINSYWFHQPSQWSGEDFVSPYSTTNENEHFGEFVEAWHVDSRYWLDKALRNYEAGHPAMLNMFLLIGNLKRPVSGDLFPLYFINDKGLFETEYVPSTWDGNKKKGVFKAQINGTDYKFTYQDHKIIDVQRSAAPLASFTSADKTFKVTLVRGNTVLVANQLDPITGEVVRKKRFSLRGWRAEDIQISIDGEKIGVLVKKESKKYGRDINAYFAFQKDEKRVLKSVLKLRSLKGADKKSRSIIFDGTPVLGNTRLDAKISPILPNPTGKGWIQGAPTPQVIPLKVEEKDVNQKLVQLFQDAYEKGRVCVGEEELKPAFTPRVSGASLGQAEPRAPRQSPLDKEVELVFGQNKRTFALSRIRNILEESGPQYGISYFEKLTPEDQETVRSSLTPDARRRLDLDNFINANFQEALKAGGAGANLEIYDRADKQKLTTFRDEIFRKRLYAHGVAADKGGLESLLAILLEGKIRSGQRGPLDGSPNPQISAGPHGPFYVVLADPNRTDWAERGNHALYLVPEGSDRNTLIYVLKQAVGAQPQFISQELEREIEKKILTYGEFVKSPSEKGSTGGLTPPVRPADVDRLSGQSLGQVQDALRKLDGIKPDYFPLAIEGRDTFSREEIRKGIEEGSIILDGRGFLTFSNERKIQILPDHWYHGTDLKAVKEMVLGQAKGLKAGNLTRSKDYADIYGEKKKSAKGDGITLDFDLSKDRLLAEKYFQKPFFESVDLAGVLPLTLLSEEKKKEILAGIPFTEGELVIARDALGLSQGASLGRDVGKAFDLTGDLTLPRQVIAFRDPSIAKALQDIADIYQEFYDKDRHAPKQPKSFDPTLFVKGKETEFGTFLPSNIWHIAEIFEKAGVKPGNRILDMGSGDGRTLAVAALFGAEVVGYEADDQLAGASRDLLKKMADQKLIDLSRVSIHPQTFDNASFGDFDFIYYFDLGSLAMSDAGLLQKIAGEMKEGAKFLVYRSVHDELFESVLGKPESMSLASLSGPPGDMGSLSIFTKQTKGASLGADINVFGGGEFWADDPLVKTGRIIQVTDYQNIDGLDLVEYAKRLREKQGVERIYVDLDLTVFRSMGYLSSSKWFENVHNLYGIGNTLGWWGDAGHEARQIANGFFFRLMDPKLSEMIRELKNSKFEVVGLTARATRDQERTEKILAGLGIELGSVLYTGGAGNKGPVLDEYEKARGPVKGLIVEDSFKNLEGVLDGRSGLSGIYYESPTSHSEDSWTYREYLGKAEDSLKAGKWGHAFEYYYNAAIKIFELKDLTRDQAYGEFEKIYQNLTSKLKDKNLEGYKTLETIVDIARKPEKESIYYQDARGRAAWEKRQAKTDALSAGLATGSADVSMTPARPAGREPNVPGTPLGLDTLRSDVDRLSGQSLGSEIFRPIYQMHPEKSPEDAVNEAIQGDYGVIAVSNIDQGKKVKDYLAQRKLDRPLEIVGMDPRAFNVYKLSDLEQLEKIFKSSDVDSRIASYHRLADLNLRESRKVLQLLIEALSREKDPRALATLIHLIDQLTNPGIGSRWHRVLGDYQERQKGNLKAIEPLRQELTASSLKRTDNLFMENLDHFEAEALELTEVQRTIQSLQLIEAEQLLASLAYNTKSRAHKLYLNRKERAGVPFQRIVYYSPVPYGSLDISKMNIQILDTESPRVMINGVPMVENGKWTGSSSINTQMALHQYLDDHDLKAVKQRIDWGKHFSQYFRPFSYDPNKISWDEFAEQEKLPSKEPPAFVEYVRSGNEAEIFKFNVTQPYRLMGLATHLFEDLLKQEAGIERVRFNNFKNERDRAFIQSLISRRKIYGPYGDTLGSYYTLKPLKIDITELSQFSRDLALTLDPALSYEKRATAIANSFQTLIKQMGLEDKFAFYFAELGAEGDLKKTSGTNGDIFQYWRSVERRGLEGKSRMSDVPGLFTGEKKIFEGMLRLGHATDDIGAFRNDFLTIDSRKTLPEGIREDAILAQDQAAYGDVSDKITYGAFRWFDKGEILGVFWIMGNVSEEDREVLNMARVLISQVLAKSFQLEVLKRYSASVALSRLELDRINQINDRTRTLADKVHQGKGTLSLLEKRLTAAEFESARKNAVQVNEQVEGLSRRVEGYLNNLNRVQKELWDAQSRIGSPLAGQTALRGVVGIQSPELDFYSKVIQAKTPSQLELVRSETIDIPADARDRVLEAASSMITEINDYQSKIDQIQTDKEQAKAVLREIETQIGEMTESLSNFVNTFTDEWLDQNLSSINTRTADWIRGVIKTIRETHQELLELLKDTEITQKVEVFDVVGEIRKVFQEESVRGDESEIDYQWTSPLEHFEIASDPSIIKNTVVRSLLNNAASAVRYFREATPGEKKISLEIEPLNDYLRIRVSDTGPGFDWADPAVREKLFTLGGRQLTEGSEKNLASTGLGLSLAQSRLRAIGGDLYLEKTEKGKGSTFTVLLPKDLADSSNILVTEQVYQGVVDSIDQQISKSGPDTEIGLGLRLIRDQMVRTKKSGTLTHLFFEDIQKVLGLSLGGINPYVVETTGDVSFERFDPDRFEQDYPIIHDELWNQSGRGTYAILTKALSPEVVAHKASLWRTYVASPDSFIVRDLSGRPIGALFASEKANVPGTIFIYSFYVHPKMQRRGIGDRLLRLVAEGAKARGVHTISLDVNEGTEAEGYYRKRGFEAVGKNEISSVPLLRMEASPETLLVKLTRASSLGETALSLPIIAEQIREMPDLVAASYFAATGASMEKLEKAANAKLVEKGAAPYFLLPSPSPSLSHEGRGTVLPSPLTGEGQGEGVIEKSLFVVLDLASLPADKDSLAKILQLTGESGRVFPFYQDRKDLERYRTLLTALPAELRTKLLEAKLVTTLTSKQLGQIQSSKKLEDLPLGLIVSNTEVLDGDFSALSKEDIRTFQFAAKENHSVLTRAVYSMIFTVLQEGSRDRSLMGDLSLHDQKDKKGFVLYQFNLVKLAQELTADWAAQTAILRAA